MITIENKETSLKLTEARNVNYADLLLTCVNRPIKEGVDLKTMRRDLRIIGVIEEAATKHEEEGKATVMEFTTEDFKAIAKAVEESKWTIAHQDILDFSDYIDGLSGKSAD